MVDYSRWKDIEVSDDEDDTHPNIDTPSLFRWRHEARVQRMEEMKQEKEEIDKIKADLKARKTVIDEKRKENAFAKKEKLAPWNVDTIGHDGFSKTVINTKEKPSAAPLTEEEKGKRLQTFTKENESLLKKFGMFRKYEDSKRFLQEYPHLVCEDTANYLVIWCINLAMEEKFELMDHVSHQCITMQFLLELAKQLERDPRTCVGSYFTKIAHVEQSEYKQAFESELDLFRKRIRRRAEEKIQEAMEEAEEEERKARLGPGGLDPVESLKTCFETRDIPMLQKALLELPADEAKLHMKRCIDSGMWCPAKEGEQGDGDKPRSTQDSEDDKRFQELQDSL
ncbi:Hsp90 co-chaperone Cdc37 [Orchesella cincta]|uniref:Hsp90 co-chaperone Cdc37 n=1 Tax=Orchesella cincta TaxID=48709 RepID=A0A1D2NMY4_ORCCI|nr:Hsp90 co-chaperone Cdc37 [Orchesella cincta]